MSVAEFPRKAAEDLAGVTLRHVPVPGQLSPEELEQAEEFAAVLRSFTPQKS